jgi:hypothetical protein
MSLPVYAIFLPPVESYNFAFCSPLLIFVLQAVYYNVRLTGAGQHGRNMDGLGLAASVIAVIQLTGSCLKLSRKFLGPSEFSSSDLNAMTTALYGFNRVVKSFRTHLEIYKDNEARLSSLEYLTPVLKQCEEALHIIQDFVTEVPRYCGVFGVTDKRSTVSAPKMDKVVCAHNLFKRKGAKPILQATVFLRLVEIY